jgi:hypothetical protein
MNSISATVRSVVLISALSLPLCAIAGKVCFGSGEKLHYVANTALRDKDGEELVISRKVTTQCFLFPYNQSDDDFVLAVRGKPSMYYKFPSSAEVARLQEEGMLPNPIPEWEAGVLDFILGYFLWFFLGACIHMSCTSSCVATQLRPNPSLKLTRYGMRCKPGAWRLRQSHTPGLQRMPPRAA